MGSSVRLNRENDSDGVLCSSVDEQEEDIEPRVIGPRVGKSGDVIERRVEISGKLMPSPRRVGTAVEDKGEATRGRAVGYSSGSRAD